MKKVGVLLLFALGILVGNAQDYSWRLTYDVSMPMGDLKNDYISKTSWRGVGVDNRWMMTDKISVGFLVSWHTFYEAVPNALATTADGNFSAYGNQFRYLNTWIGQANIHYYFGESGQVNPWIGLGVGSAYSVQKTLLGLYSLSYDPWSLSLAPQAGIDVPLGMNTDFTLAVRYNYLMNGKDKATSDFGYIGINAGFKFLVF